MSLFQICQKIQNGFFFSNRIFVYISLILLFIIRNSPSLFLIKNINNICFPLESIYITNLIFSPAWNIAPGLIDGIISPSNAALVYPPGIYILINLLSLTSVFKIIFFNFLIQLIVPIIFYELLRTRTNTTIAFFIAVFSVLFMTDAGWWAPDFIIQALMLPIFFIFVYNDGAYLKKYQILFALGICTGLIILLKHNIGIFFTIVCATILLLQCIQPNKTDVKMNLLNKLFTYFIFIGFLAFGVIFSLRLPHFDEFLFYLMPYFIFFILFWLFLKKSDQSFSLHDTLVKVIPYGLGAIIFPVSIFYWFGSKIGFANYAYSLFGMGFNYLHIWDYGIIEIIRSNFNPFGSISSIIFSPILLVMFVFPLIVNCYALYCIYLNSKIQPCSQDLVFLQPYKIAAIGIISIFMFFPLEGAHILETKIFIYIFIFFALKDLFSSDHSKFFTRMSVLLGIIVICIIGVTFTLAVATPSSYGVSELKTTIGIPLSNNIANNLQSQIKIVDRSIQGEPYYIVDGSGSDLFYLASVIPNKYPQYYIEMRPGIMSDMVANRIIQDISGLNHVIVRSDDYYNALDPNMSFITNYLKENFIVKDQYTLKDSKFLVLERKI